MMTTTLDDNNNKKMRARKMSTSMLHQHNHHHKDLNNHDNSNKYQLLQDCTRHRDRQVSEKKKVSSSCNNHIVRPFNLFLIFLQITCQILIIANVIVQQTSNYNSFSVNAHLILPKVATRFQTADRRFGFGGAGASVDIALEKVPENKGDNGQYGYGAKKKFPITWLRNQYPFNKKKKSKYSYVNQHHQQQEQLYGQYSNQQYDVLDPNPSTWVKLTPPSQVNIKPIAPTAQVPAFFIQAPVSQQQVSNLQPFSIAASHQLAAQPVNVAPTHVRYPQTPTNDVMQFSSSDQIIQQQYSNKANQIAGTPLASGNGRPPPAAAGARGRPPRGPGNDASKGADSAAGDGYGSGGFGGVSLQFGNGRSISFGGGQGLTIGTKAGAISIGGKGGGSEGGGETLASQGSHSDGYSSGGRTISIGGGRGITIGGGGGGSYDTGDSGGGGDYGGKAGGSSYGDNSSSGYGNNKYYKKNYKPTMSIEMPKKGKTVIHADLDMAPIKVKLHSSPRVKITTGSRDPLEKPSDEEQEPEEDIFEPPEPFVKVNSTSSGNDTSLSNSTTANGNATQPLNGTTQLFDNGQFVDDYYYNNQKQQHYPPPLSVNGYQQVNQFYDVHQRQQHYQHNHANNQFQSGSPAPAQPFNPYHTPAGHLPPFNHIQQQQQQQQHPHDQPNYHQHWQDQVDSLNDHHGGNGMPLRHANERTQQQPNQANVDDRRQPGLAQWRQFSKEAKNNLPRPNHHESALDADHDRFYSHADQPKQPLPPTANTTPNSMQAGAPSFDDHPYDPTRSLINNGPPSPMSMHQPSVGGAKQPVWGPIMELPNNSLDNSSVRQHNVHLANTRYQIGNGQPIFDADYSSSDNVKSYALKPSASQQYPLTSKALPVQYHEQQVQQQQQQDLYQPGSARHHGSYVGGPQSVGHQDYKPMQQAQYDVDQSGQSAYNSNGAAKNYQKDGYSSQSGSQANYGGAGSGYTSYGSNGYEHSGGDGYNKNDYATKVEKYEPGAHDKRERSKVILFLKPRISIHQANSSTTTKRPKNRQRLLHVINKPIFLNNTGNHTHDDEWMDPDLKDTSGHGYGYAHGYGNGYGRDYSKSSSTTTKKPKTTTTTTSTTTTVSPDGDSSTTTTTESSSTSEGTTTTDSTSDSSSSTTEPTTTTTGSDGNASSSPSSSSTTEGTSSEGSTLEVEGEPSSSTESSGSTTEKEEPSSTTSATSTSTEPEEEEEEPSTTTSTTTTTTASSMPKKKKTKQGSTTTTTTTTTELPLPPLDDITTAATITTSSSTTQASNSDQSSVVDIFASTSSPAAVVQPDSKESTSSTLSPVPDFDSNPSEEDVVASLGSSTTSMAPPTAITRRAMTSKPPPPPQLSQRQQTEKTSAKVVSPLSQASNSKVQQQQTSIQVKQAQAIARKPSTQSTTTTTTTTTEQPPTTSITTLSPEPTTTLLSGILTSGDAGQTMSTSMLGNDDDISFTQVNNLPEFPNIQEGSLNSISTPVTMLSQLANSNSELFRAVANVDPGTVNGMSDSKLATAFTSLASNSKATAAKSTKTVSGIINLNAQSVLNMPANSASESSIINGHPLGDATKLLTDSALESIITTTTSTTSPSGEPIESLDSTTTPISIVSDASGIVSSSIQQPMLLNEELIEKLMRNKTLVNLMSNQLMKVMNTNGEKFDNNEKMNLVRLVFDQMMLKKVDFSSNNVRLAVKTVSSSYKEALQKSGASNSSPVSLSNANDNIKSTRSSSNHQRSKSNSFGQRVQPDDSYPEASSNIRSNRSSKSIRAIDTALRLTSNGNRKSGSSSRGNQDNPIVVVLLPQEKAR